MDTLRESIQSVLDQTLKPDRFIVIDNASTDDSRKIAKDMGIQVVDADNRHKFITGLNKAIVLNQDLLFFMQNDVVLDKECLKTMVRNSPHYERFFAQPVIYQTDGEIDNAGMDYFWPGFGQRRNTKWWSRGKFQNCGLVSTICFLTNNKFKEYDTLFSPAYYEDLDMYLRTRGDFKHVLIPDAKAVHRGNHTFSQTLKKRQISDICRRNRRKLIRKHYSGFDCCLRLSVTACLDVMKKSFDVVRDWWVSKNNGKKVSV